MAPWAAYLAKRLLHVLRYIPGDHCFQEWSGQVESWTPVGDAAMVGRLMEAIRTAPIGPATAKTCIDEKWLRSILMPKLRAALSADSPKVHAYVAEFLKESVAARKGANFTLAEFYGAFDQYQAARSKPRFSHWDVGKSVRRLMAGPPWLKRISKSIIRENGCNDGYRGFFIGPPEPATSAEIGGLGGDGVAE